MYQSCVIKHIPAEPVVYRQKLLKWEGIFEEKMVATSPCEVKVNPPPWHSLAIRGCKL